jgi:hypothetical protein
MLLKKSGELDNQENFQRRKREEHNEEKEKKEERKTKGKEIKKRF